MIQVDPSEKGARAAEDDRRRVEALRRLEVRRAERERRRDGWTEYFVPRLMADQVTALEWLMRCLEVEDRGQMAVQPYDGSVASPDQFRAKDRVPAVVKALAFIKRARDAIDKEVEPRYPMAWWLCGAVLLRRMTPQEAGNVYHHVVSVGNEKKRRAMAVSILTACGDAVKGLPGIRPGR